ETTGYESVHGRPVSYHTDVGCDDDMHQGYIFVTLAPDLSEPLFHGGCICMVSETVHGIAWMAHDER
ncbi:MAG: hypothetical protein LUC41_06900, partial [Clostridiales bacterium]|nr:hypothetical protein [Clostridiales bacterium]